MVALLGDGGIPGFLILLQFPSLHPIGEECHTKNTMQQLHVKWLS